MKQVEYLTQELSKFVMKLDLPSGVDIEIKL